MKKGGRVKLTMWHRTVLRAAAEHPIVLNEISEPMREKLIDLAMMEPPLVDTDGPRVFATPAGRALLEDGDSEGNQNDHHS